MNCELLFQALIDDLKRYIPNLNVWASPSLQNFLLCGIQDKDTFRFESKKHIIQTRNVFGMYGKEFKLPDDIIDAKKEILHKFSCDYSIFKDPIANVFNDVLIFLFENYITERSNQRFFHNDIGLTRQYFANYDRQNPIFSIQSDANNKLMLYSKKVYPFDIEEIDGELIGNSISELEISMFVSKFLINNALSLHDIYETITQLDDYKHVIEIFHDSEIDISSVYSKDGVLRILFDNGNKASITLSGNDYYFSIDNYPKQIILKSNFKQIENFVVAYLSYLETGVVEKPEVKIEKPIDNEEFGINLSEDAKEFIINAQTSDENDIESQLLLGDFVDKINETDFASERVKRFYDIYSNCVAVSLSDKKQYRDVYVSKNVLDTIKKLGTHDFDDAINSIKDNLNKLTGDDLGVYLKSKNLVYMKPYLKIRVKNNEPHRLLLAYGRDIHKNDNNIYVVEYIVDHNFSNIKNINASSRTYYLWKNDTKAVPEIDDDQALVSEMTNSPLLCTGCAGSGKTLISVNMYWLLADLFKSEKIDKNKLVYVTYNEPARINAHDQILARLNDCNTKTLDTLFMDIIGVNNYSKDELKDFYDRYVGEEHFANFCKSTTDYKLRDRIYDLKINDKYRYLYTFYRGIYKGSLYRWEVDPTKERTLTKKQFITLLKKEPIEKEMIDLIYEVCFKYQQELEKNNLFDDNDLARMAIKKCLRDGGIYEHIIIDEVQDLTEVQLDAVVKTSTNKMNLYFFGDKNQYINPTLFDIDSIEMCLLRNNSFLDKNNIISLNKSYRFGPLLASYINVLVNLKRKWIGTVGIVETESSNLKPDTDKWGGWLINNQKARENLLFKATTAANAMIVVPDQKVKDDLVKQGLDESRIITIYDSKGLEWDYIVLYNMLGFSNDKYLEMLSGKAKHSTLHRMIFNQYYVACTRAMSCFVVVETKLDKVISDQMLKALPKVDTQNIDFYIKGDTDKQSWANEALRLFKSGNYSLAKSAFEKADIVDIRYAVCDIMDRYTHNKVTTNDALTCKNNGYYHEASMIYLRLGDRVSANLMMIYDKTYLDDDQIYEILNMNKSLTEADYEVIANTGFFERKKQITIKALNKINEMLEDMNNGFNGNK